MDIRWSKGKGKVEEIRSQLLAIPLKNNDFLMAKNEKYKFTKEIQYLLEFFFVVIPPPKIGFGYFAEIHINNYRYRSLDRPK